MIAEYAGASCTNQFVRSLSALGAATCATVDLAADITGTLPVENGGTEATSLTDHGVLVGSGTGAITPLAVGTNGQLLVGSTGADPVFATLNCADGLTCTTGAGTLEIDFDGTDSPQGELGGTWASPTIDDSLAVTSWTLTTPLFLTSLTASDDDWVGLGSGAGRLIFDDLATDVLSIENARFGIASSSPMSLFGVAGTSTVHTLNIMNPSHTGTSTMYIYSPTAAFGGEVILEDSDGAGCTSITALNGTVTGITVTCPADPVAN